MDITTADPCRVCGNTQVKLIDGYYYCLECGTQDENVRETRIEGRALADGTFSIRQKKKVRTIVKETKYMSPEWYKWHAYNFILEGLCNELINLGAKKSVKMKVLWIWTKYMKKFQDKEELGLQQSKSMDPFYKNTDGKRYKDRIKMVGNMIKSLLFAILYVALNLDGSDILLSDLIRFAEEERLSIDDCEKFVPKQIKVELIPNWLKFHRSSFSRKAALKAILPLFKSLYIRPQMPDLRLLVDRYIKELCLPNDFKILVLSLMQLAPHNLDLEENCDMLAITDIEYELKVMSYIIVAFKMCFGLDDDYEVKLSEAVDKINKENCHLKCYKFNTFADSDRLFSFKDWCNFLELRKIILCKFNIHFAKAYFHNVDDYVFMEQTYADSVPPKKIKITDELVMKLLENIPQTNTVEVIPKSEFKPTKTPLSSYTELILDYLDDADLRMLLSEDFTKYSLKYATENLHLLGTDGNVVVGIKEENKEIKSEITGTFQCVTHNPDIVYVRNCDNKNWVKTNQPTLEHIKIIDESSSGEKDIDQDNNSHTETGGNEADLTIKINEELDKESHVIIKEEVDSVNIFDDDFEDLKDLDIKEEIDDELINTEPPDIPENIIPQESINDNINDNLEIQSFDSDFDTFFDPQKFDRQKTIRDLVLATCKKYKARIPDEYKEPKEPRKRKANVLNDKAGGGTPKRPKQKAESNKSKSKAISASEEINNLLNAYFENMQKDVLNELSTQVKSVINNAYRTNLVVENDTSLLQNDTIDVSHRNTEQNEYGDNNDLDQNGSVQCLDETDVMDDEETVNPKFDETDYDTKQLYVKVNRDNEVDRDCDSDDALDILNDPDVVGILDKKIEEIVKMESITFPLNRRREPDSDDDIPLSVLREEKLSILREMEEKKLANTIYPPLVRSEVKDFKYWTRYYPQKYWIREMHYQFQEELIKNYPKSFYFVINECALIIRSNLFKLYKHVRKLEEMITT